MVGGGYSHQWYTRVELLNYDPVKLQIEYCNRNEDHLPDYPLKVNYAVANVVDGEVTVCGGVDLFTNKPINQCYQLDHNQVAWKPFPSTVFPRSQSGGGLTAQGWWIIGGDYSRDANARNTTEIFKNGAWQLGPRIPEIFDFWVSPCIANINDTHTFVVGGNSNDDRHSTWIYNWLKDTWTILDFVPSGLGISSCFLTQPRGSKFILAGSRDYYSLFNLDEAKWGERLSTGSCYLDKAVFIGDIPVTMTQGTTACSFNGTHWLRSPNISLILDYPRRYEVAVANFLPLTGKSCQSNVMVLTGSSGEYIPTVEVIPVSPSNEKCRLPPFPRMSSFDVSFFLHEKEIVGCYKDGCYKLDTASNTWKSTYFFRGYIWTSTQPTSYGTWKTGGAQNYDYNRDDCYQSPQKAGYCVGVVSTYINCYGTDQTIEGPILPRRSFGHCTINLNETHTMIAGGLQTNSSSRCSSTPLLNADINCQSNLTWIYNWNNEEWTQAQDLPRRTAFASCGHVEVGGKRFVLIIGQDDVQGSRYGTVQLWSYETETWSADVAQPIGGDLSLPSK